MVTTDQNLITAIIYDEDDANLFLKIKPFVNRILPITPNAHAILLECSVPLINTTDIYTDCRQAKVLARVRRTESELLSVLENEKHLGVASKETLRGIAHVLFSISASFWELVKYLGPCLLPDGKGWIKLVDPKQIHQFLLEHLQPQIQKTMIPYIGVPVLSFIIKRINRIALSIWTGRPTIIFSDYSYGLNKLRFHKNFDLYSICMRGADGGCKDLILSIKFLLDSLFFRKTGTMIIVPQYSFATAETVRKVLKITKDPISRAGVKLVQDSLINTVTMHDGLKDDISKVFEKLKPRQIISGHLRWWTPAFVAEVGKKYKIPVTLITHGSHSLSDSAIAAFEQKENTHGLMMSPLSDITLLQSPHAEAYALKLEYTNGQRSRPIQWGIGKKISTSSNTKIRYILHAGTYKPWLSPRPWIYETPDEFINGLTSLIIATGKLKNTKLIIRIRPQSDCSLSNLKKLLPKVNHYEIKSSGSFLDNMSKADLLVSWSSTTIEEALHLRKPVLLWGGSKRYFYLPPCSKLPTARNRSEVYSPESKDDLSHMIEAILDNHVGKPLTDEELNAHVWNENISGVNEFVRQLGTAK